MTNEELDKLIIPLHPALLKCIEFGLYDIGDTKFLIPKTLYKTHPDGNRKTRRAEERERLNRVKGRRRS